MFSTHIFLLLKVYNKRLKENTIIYIKQTIKAPLNGCYTIFSYKTEQSNFSAFCLMKIRALSSVYDKF